jgi:hypothetical protein
MARASSRRRPTRSRRTRDSPNANRPGTARAGFPDRYSLRWSSQVQRLSCDDLVCALPSSAHSISQWANRVGDEAVEEEALCRLAEGASAAIQASRWSIFPTLWSRAVPSVSAGSWAPLRAPGVARRAGLPIPCPSKSSAIVTRERSRSPSGSTVPLTIPLTGPSIPRAAQLLGGLSSVSSVVIGTSRRPIRRVITSLDPTAREGRRPRVAQTRRSLPLRETRRVGHVRDDVLGTSGYLDALHAPSQAASLVSFDRAAEGSRRLSRSNERERDDQTRRSALAASSGWFAH